jgi:hypothetical protein
VRRMRTLFAGAEWHVYEVRYVWLDDGVFVTSRIRHRVQRLLLRAAQPAYPT